MTNSELYFINDLVNKYNGSKKIIDFHIKPVPFSESVLQIQIEMTNEYDAKYYGDVIAKKFSHPFFDHNHKVVTDISRGSKRSYIFIKVDKNVFNSNKHKVLFYTLFDPIVDEIKNVRDIKDPF